MPARDSKNLETKIAELESINVSFIVVCGEKVDHPNVVYQANRGKWAAINFGSTFIPKEAKVVVLNDVDTIIHHFNLAYAYLREEIPLVYCRVKVSKGPQVKFYKILDPLRAKFHIAASGELMLVRKDVFERTLPLPACIAEDSFILFKTLELGYKAKFCKSAYVTTARTINAQEEVRYKNRTTLGIFQALDYAKAPPVIRIFYFLLPFFVPFLYFLGDDGKAWTKGIFLAFRDSLMKKVVSKF